MPVFEALCVRRDTIEFKVGQHVKYMPPYRTESELLQAAELSGLEPRKIYRVKKIDHEILHIEGGGKDHISSFKSGELEAKLGKVDDSWQEQKKRLIDRHANFNHRNT